MTWKSRTCQIACKVGCVTSPAETIASALSRLRGRRHQGPHHHGHRHGPPPWMTGGPMRGGPARARLLDALASGPLSVSAIGEVIGVDQPRASRLVQQAVELGLVERQADPDDARRTLIALTDQGRDLARTFGAQRRETVERALAGFTEAERAELARLLTKLADGWGG